MKKIQIIWIDDINGNNRKNMSKVFEDYKSNNFPGYNNSVDYQDFNAEDVNLKVSQLLQNKKEPDLIIIDHFLDKTAGGILVRGSTVAQILRDRGWIKCAFIGITAAKKIKGVDLESESLYVDLIEATEFTKYYDKIISIAISYYELNKLQGKIKTLEDLLMLLYAPDEEVNKLLKVVPEIIKESINRRKIFSFSTSKWVIHILLTFPGFLYDDLWTATILGLNKSGFEIYKKKFDKALYKGIFYDPSNPRWWVIKLKQIIFKLYPSESISYSWELGRKLTKNSKYYSKCHKCKKDFPEIVGYIDESLSSRAPLHINCSDLLSESESRLFFESNRIMKKGD